MHMQIAYAASQAYLSTVTAGPSATAADIVPARNGLNPFLREREGKIRTRLLLNGIRDVFVGEV